MQTEHVFQIGVSVDDQAIQDSAIAAATKLVVEATTNTLIYKSSYSRGYELSSNGEEIVSKAITDLVNENKDFLIEQIINRTVEKLFRSKMLKDKVGDIDA